MNLFKKIEKVIEPQKYKWPDCAPPEGEYGNTYYNDEGGKFIKKEVEPGKWQWVFDEKHAEKRRKAEEETAKEIKKRNDLYWALRSRVLTAEEMKQVVEYGDSLRYELLDCCGYKYNPERARTEMNEALFQQFKMRLALEEKNETR